jgi:dUTP pyrophosphatase
MNINSAHKTYAILRLCIVGNNTELKQMYKNAVDTHNTQLSEESHYNAGFDLITPSEYILYETKISHLINLGVKAEMKMVGGNYGEYTGYYLYPRSSISKTPLMMANHVGIIDSGYRGNILAAVRTIQEAYVVNSGTRLFQICHPNLMPMYVELVDDESQLSESTRGVGGFGSTGGLNV